MLDLTAMNKKFLIEVVRVFAFAFVGAFVPLVTGIINSPNWEAGKAAAVAAVFAALSAAVKAVFDLITKGVNPAPSVGVLPPSVKNG
jgi:hypothetical protein